MLGGQAGWRGPTSARDRRSTATRLHEPPDTVTVGFEHVHVRLEPLRRDVVGNLLFAEMVRPGFRKAMKTETPSSLRINACASRDGEIERVDLGLGSRELLFPRRTKL